MQHADEDKKTVPRTYRFSPRTYDALRRYRVGLEPPPSETALVELAIREFLERRDSEASKRAARR